MKRWIAVLVGLVLASATLSSALAAKVGDPAAPLKIKEWIKGKAVDVKDGKNYYVVEFWATWCGPCRVSIPHLTELQKELKDKGVVMIGISTETADKVKPFVEQQGEKMDYLVALDEDQATSKAYMEAYGQNGIPHAFVVGKDGKMIWHGHPMDGLDKALREMVAGKYNLQAAIDSDSARASMDEYQTLSRSGDAKAKELGRKLLEQKGKDTEALCEFAFGIAADTRNQSRDFALAEEALDRAEKAAGAKTGRVLSIRAITRFENGKHDEGLSLLKEAVGLAKDDQEKSRYQNWVQIMERRKETLSKKPAAPATK